jgi:alpha-D-xyloside xylohydrolase
MLVTEPSVVKWSKTEQPGRVIYRSPRAEVVLEWAPFRIEIRDEFGKVLLRTQHPSDTRCMRNSDPVPFCFLRTSPEHARRFAATFANFPDEKYYGCGESFTRLNKRGQRVVLYTYDPHGAQTDGMYKPVPFFLSSRGYGAFLHTTSPCTFDFGEQYDGATTLFSADAELDLFVFVGEPKDVLEAYTALTGRSPVPPLWSFGLWMSRCTYDSAEQVLGVANELRRRKIPSDVLHVDTGWFEENFRCDFEFSKTRFDAPKVWLSGLRDLGFRVSLWQLPYFTPKNHLYGELVERGFVIRGPEGYLPTEDAILDFANTEALAWYKERLAALLRLGVAAIKADFGEAAPLHGLYASGVSGMREHNAYPLRYNRAVAEVTSATTGENIIWARSAWAGSQCFPVHWGGDAEDTDSAMAATLRAGLSLGICGFSFWSHDIGGFPHPPSRDLYRRWLPFGMLTSHSRCHGVPPREPWTYDESFVEYFREVVELKYRLMPYVYTQARLSAARGFPVLRALFFEHPEDPTCWLVEDQYFFGSDLLVAPLFESVESRDVYLPKGGWIDYQTNQYYDGGRWVRLSGGALSIVLLVRDGAVLPVAPVAQHTAAIEWDEVEGCVYRHRADAAKGALFRPDRAALEWLDDATKDNPYTMTRVDVRGP